MIIFIEMDYAYLGPEGSYIIDYFRRLSFIDREFVFLRIVVFDQLDI